VIRYKQGNLLASDAQALVNTVNTVGVMGKGIALMFKQRFPLNFQLYAAACKAQQVQTGRMFVTEVGELDGPRWVVNFPTKQHWRDPSQMAWVIEGLQDLRRFLVDESVQSVAIPPLGAGLGGLFWPAVQAQIEQALADLPLDIQVYEPAGTQQITPSQRRQALDELNVLDADLRQRELDEARLHVTTRWIRRQP